jgi:hypothetical protein
MLPALTHRSLLVPIAVVGLTLLWASTAAACGRNGYTYAGIFSPPPANGISATITPLTAFEVKSGHVAAWVGIGGPGKGPHGQDEWLQIGLSAFPDFNGNHLYYELALPGSTPTYTELEPNLPFGSSTRVAVLEVRDKPNYWRVWVNQSPASPPIHLPASHHRLQPTATAESWDGGTDGPCNTFLYRFRNLTTPRTRGGWQPLTNAYTITDTNTHIRRSANGTFLATQDTGA